VSARSVCLAAIALVFWAPAGLGARSAEDARPVSSDEVQRRWHERLSGRTFVASVVMDVDLDGLREDRRLTVVRDDEAGTTERVMIRFDSPPSLRNVGLLYLEQDDRANDYFLYRPAARRVRRLPEEAVTENLYGLDPEFLGFGVARSEPTEVESLNVVALGASRAYRLVERALEDNRRFDERTVWVDEVTGIPLRTEHRLDGKTVLTAETLEIKEVQGVATPVRMRFARPVDRVRVELLIEEVDYDASIPADVFSVFALTKSQDPGH